MAYLGHHVVLRSQLVHGGVCHPRARSVKCQYVMGLSDQPTRDRGGGVPVSLLCETELLQAIFILLRGCKLMLNLFSVEFKKQRYNLSNRLVRIQSLFCDKRYVALFLLCIMQF